MPTIEYTIYNNEQEKQFEIEMDGEKAYLTYRFYKQDIALMHTTVPKSLEGKGIATAFSIEAFSYAKKQKKLVMIYCTFVAQFVQKYTSYKTQIENLVADIQASEITMENIYFLGFSQGDVFSFNYKGKLNISCIFASTCLGWGKPTMV